MEFVGIIIMLLVLAELLDFMVVCDVFWFRCIEWELSATTFWARITPFPRLGELCAVFALVVSEPLLNLDP
jgi:hypothetical protein